MVILYHSFANWFHFIRLNTKQFEWNTFVKFCTIGAHCTRHQFIHHHSSLIRYMHFRSNTFLCHTVAIYIKHFCDFWLFVWFLLNFISIINLMLVSSFLCFCLVKWFCKNLLNFLYHSKKKTQNKILVDVIKEKYKLIWKKSPLILCKFAFARSFILLPVPLVHSHRSN